MMFCKKNLIPCCMQLAHSLKINVVASPLFVLLLLDMH